MVALLRNFPRRSRSGRNRQAHTWRPLLEQLEGRVLLTAGDLDLSFDVDGKVRTSFVGPAQAYAVALAPDGKIVAAGMVDVSPPTNRDFDVGVARYNLDGSLDASFGSGGKITTNTSQNEQANAVTVQEDGKVIVAGFSYRTSTNQDFMLQRYNSDGTLDSSFGTGGIVFTNFSSANFDIAYGVVVQPDGKIIAVGSTQALGSNFGYFALARYNDNGTLDSGFGIGGLVISQIGGGAPDRAHAVTLQPDGKILVAGVAELAATPNFALARYNANGSADTSFGSGGSVHTDFTSGYDEARGLVLQPDGKIVVAGNVYTNPSRDFGMARYNANGTLDNTFGTGGKVKTDLQGNEDNGLAVALQDNGRIVVAGRTYNTAGAQSYGLVRYQPDGSLNTSFGTGGKVVTPILASNIAYGVAIQTDGKIVAAGMSTTPTEFSLARYEGDGPNVAPTAEALGPFNVYEGYYVLLNGANSSDPEQSTASLNFQWDLDGDGIFGETGAAAPNGIETGMSTYFLATGLDGPSTRTVTLRVTDAGGASSTDTATIHVNNLNPTVNAGANTTINEGATFTRTGTITDPGPDTFTATVNYGDGGGTQSLTVNANNTFDLSHVYADNGAYTITVTVTDDDSAVGVDTVLVTVNNVAPTATFGNNGPVNEASAVTVSFTNPSDPSTPDTDAVFHYSFALSSDDLVDSYGDAGTATSASYTFDDNGSYTVYGRIFDDDGGATDYTTTVTVNNVAPTATFGNNGPVNEASAVAVSFTTPSDPSTPDTDAGFHYSFALSSGALAGSYGAAGTATSVSFTFGDNGSYTVYGRIFDDDGGATDYTTTVTVNNVAPTATFGNNGPVNEASAATVSFASPSDPSTPDTDAGFHYSFALSSGGLAGSYGDAGTATSASFTFDDDGSYAVFGRIFDDDGGSTDYITTVIVINFAPTSTLGNNGPVNEASAVSVSFTNSSDPSTPDTDAGFHYSFALSSDDLADSYGDAGTATSASFTFDDNGSYTVYGRIYDDDGGATDYSTTVTVINVVPAAAFGNNGPVNEANAVTASFTNPTDPSSADTDAGFHYSFALSSGALAGSYGAAGTATSASFTFNDNGSYTVYGRIFDDDGGATDYTTTVTVNNVAPTAGASGPATGVRGQVRTFTFTASDVSPVDQAAPFDYLVDWGDGSTPQVVNDVGATLQLDHIFTSAATFTVRVWATDKDNDQGAAASAAITIKAAELQGSDLIVGGTTAGDTIVIKPKDTAGNLDVTINGTLVGTFKPTGQIVVYAQAGNDSVQLQSLKIRNTTTTIAVPAVLQGQDGNDTLNAAGSSANNVLLGGAGADSLQGGGGRGLLIGGSGADTLRGGSGDDILIGGTTSHDASLTALNALMAEWGRTNVAYADRINHLTGATPGGANGSYLLNASTVQDDAAIDQLYGEGNQDWFLYRNSGAFADVINDKKNNETATAI